MTHDPVTIKENTEIADICSLMSDKNIHLLPVVKKNKLVGVVGKYDIMKAFLDVI